MALSLPSLAHKSMFKDFSASSPLVYTFSKDFFELNQLFRKQLYGGLGIFFCSLKYKLHLLVNVYRRHVTTADSEYLPHAARYTDNGSKITGIVGLDFTSMIGV